jgi:hypothetical protein
MRLIGAGTEKKSRAREDGVSSEAWPEAPRLSGDMMDDGGWERLNLGCVYDNVRGRKKKYLTSDRHKDT